MPEKELLVLNPVKVRMKELLTGASFIFEPVVPELSFRPYFMARLDGQLVFVEIAHVADNENTDWKALRLIEHLFEIKLFCGNKASVTLIIMDSRDWAPYCLELLINFFDKAIYYEDLNTQNDLCSYPKESNFDLWNKEREFTRSRHKDYRKEDLDVFRFSNFSERSIKQELYSHMQINQVPIQTEYPLRNLKNYYMNRALDLKFYFDFYANGNIVEVKSMKKVNEEAIQNLMIKARLIRYRKINDAIVQGMPENIRHLILVINGDLRGPTYDQFRYLRMLTGAGWDVYPLTGFFERIREGFP